jgi:N-methylhydantoinase A
MDSGYGAARARDGGPGLMIAADTGGTFTDLAIYDPRTGRTRFGKTLTTYGDLIEGVMTGLGAQVDDLSGAELFKHGTTHVINAFIQRKGARTALIATTGFRDVLEIARGNRAETFNLHYRRLPPLVPRDLRFEVVERIGGRGEVVTPLDIDSARALVPRLRAAGVEAVAISLLNAYANDTHERQLRTLLAEWLPGVYITTGSALSREWMEYERTSTAAANAFVGPTLSSYVRGFERALADRAFAGRFYMMASSGGVMSPEATVEQPIGLVESGPVGGCIGAAAYARELGYDKLIAFDMGGTTAKCALVENGQFEIVSTYWVDGYERGFPVRTPVLDILEVGAGGGSIAWLDDNGRLRVGPRSAGSDPGPIAFGLGGERPTVTDANVVLGRIGASSFMDGTLELDRAAAEAAIETQLAAPLGYTGADAAQRVARGILELAATTMAGAIKAVTIERGRDIRDYTLFAFGGGGPLFGAELARRLGVAEVVVPPEPGAFSSLGMLMSEARRDLARTFLRRVSADTVTEAQVAFDAMGDELRATMRDAFGDAPASFVAEADMSYEGQSHSVRVRMPAPLSTDAIRTAFEDVYRARYGHLNEGTAVAFVILRLGALVATPRPALADLHDIPDGGEPRPFAHRRVWFARSDGEVETPIYRRSQLPVGARIGGPAIVEEYSSTTLLAAGDRMTVGRLGELRITCGSDARSASA